VTNRFAICIGSRGCGDLTVGKGYPTLADRVAAANGYLRVIDESGDDYLYPATYLCSSTCLARPVDAGPRGEPRNHCRGFPWIVRRSKIS
jgi:hypothetical protein